MAEYVKLKDTIKEYRIIPREELVKRTKADLTLMRKLKTLDYYAYRIEIARRQKTGAFRSARPKGVIK